VTIQVSNLLVIYKRKKDEQMKIMLQTIAGVSMLLSATFANASTILTANNTDVDFIVPDGLGSSLLVAVFATANELQTAATPEIVNFNNFIPGFFGSPDLVSGQVMMAPGTSFVVGVSNDNGSSWIADSGYSGGTTGVLSFSSTSANLANTDILLVDVQLATVPVPASIWMFGAGLIGLTGVARRKLS